MYTWCMYLLSLSLSLSLYIYIYICMYVYMISIIIKEVKHQRDSDLVAYIANFSLAN